MATRKGCCGPFASSVGILHYLIEESVAPTRHRQSFLMVGEVMPYVREYASGDIFQSSGLVVVLRACNGKEDEDDVVDEERHEDDEHRVVELLVAEEESE